MDVITVPIRTYHLHDECPDHDERRFTIMQECLHRLQESYRSSGIEGEEVKSTQDVDSIRFFEQHMVEELEGLGLSLVSAGLDGHVHFLSTKLYRAYGGQSVNRFGLYNPSLEMGYINLGARMRRLERYLVVWDELLHYLGYHDYLLAPDRFDFQTYRCGYWINQQDNERYRGFDDGIHAKILDDFTMAYGQSFLRAFRFSEEEAQRPVILHEDERLVVEAFLTATAERLGRSERDVWLEFKRGYFTGSDAELSAAIETLQADKPGVNKVLEAFGLAPARGSTEEAMEWARQFFLTDNQAEAAKLGAQVYQAFDW